MSDSDPSKVPEERIVKLLEEIRDLQKNQLELSQKNFSKYEQAVETQDKLERRGKKIQTVFLIVMVLFLLFVIYAEWFLDGIPQPSWLK